MLGQAARWMAPKEKAILVADNFKYRARPIKRDVLALYYTRSALALLRIVAH
jgi:hypothetical protein